MWRFNLAGITFCTICGIPMFGSSRELCTLCEIAELYKQEGKGDNVVSYQVSRFIKELDRYGLTKQQKKTLRGQALKGDLEGAIKGLRTIARGR